MAYNSEENQIEINWEYPTSSNYYFVIYRSYDGSIFQSYKSVDGTLLSYQDKGLLGPGKYSYAVVAYYKDGGSSGFSKKVTLIVEE